MANILIVCAEGDEALADALARVLSRAGHAVSREPGDGRAMPTLAVWTRRSSTSPQMQRVMAGPHRVVIVLCDDAAAPAAMRTAPCVELRHWHDDAGDPRLGVLLQRIEQAWSVWTAEQERRRSEPASLREPGDHPPITATANSGLSAPRPSLRPLPGPTAPPEGVASATPPPRRPPHPPSLGPPTGAAAGRGLGGWLRRLFSASPSHGPAPVPPARPTSRPPAAAPVATPVCLAATAPRTCRLGTPFVVALSAYVEAARAQAMQHLAALGEEGDRRVADVPASSWLVGAPVSVRLAAEGAVVQPTEQRTAWNGRELLAPFTVTVAPEAGTAAVLLFAVFIADVAVATLPLRVAVGTDDATPTVATALSARSAFASYASKDAAVVAQKLSALARWAPSLDIFMDCLDLRPGEDFKPQLASQIERRDVFLLFWSRRAAASPWVRWEFETAVAHKRAEAILPMPIEDPELAPLPPELARRHLRDRYLLAGYALERVRGSAAGGAALPRPWPHDVYREVLMPFLPRDFVIPEPPANDEFTLTPLRVEHLVLDYEAVMSSRERLWQLFGPGWGWPRADLSLMQDLVDLGWHQKEFQLRRSFNWAVMSPDQRTLLGCCYLDPSETPAFDAEGYYWARSDRIAGGLEERLGTVYRAWVAAAWPFQRVAWPGRDQPW